MRFLVDLPLSPALAVWLQARGHDAVHAMHVGLARASDATILQRAAAEGQVIITADLDYPRLLAVVHAATPGVIPVSNALLQLLLCEE